MISNYYHIPDHCVDNDDDDDDVMDDDEHLAVNYDMANRRPSLLSYIAYNTVLRPIIENSDDEGNGSEVDSADEGKKTSLEILEKGVNKKNSKNKKSKGSKDKDLNKRNSKKKSKKDKKVLKDNNNSSNGDGDSRKYDICENAKTLNGRVPDVCSSCDSGQNGTENNKSSCLTDGVSKLRGSRLARGIFRLDDKSSKATPLLVHHPCSKSLHEEKNGDSTHNKIIPYSDTDGKSCNKNPDPSCAIYEIDNCQRSDTPAAARLSNHEMFVPDDDYREKFVGKQLVKLVALMGLGFVLVGGIVAWVFSPAIF